MVASRGRSWIEALASPARVVCFDAQPSVVFANGSLGGSNALFVSVVPDPSSRFARARNGEVGVQEGWAVAQLVRDTIAADRDGSRRSIIAVVDVPGQAYGRVEESAGIHLACAAAVHACADARLAGHPVIALLVGNAMSGAFLAFGYQANRIIALNDPQVLVQAMGRQSAARITRRSIAEVDALGESALPMSYRIDTFARFGLLHALIEGVDADAPSAADVDRVRKMVATASDEVRASGRKDLGHRLESAAARTMRHASIEVRRRLAEQWQDP
ncbi:MAG TPA: biotin-independent malonate decarboxylase subunit gamma [Steroidobacteraceae bacterium]|nr:biotin-independent malonate decarboxylase subunit gamma [Steroidobacteraceae bacterium]